MELPEDVVGRLVQFAPWEFLGVSRGLDISANAALDSQAVVEPYRNTNSRSGTVEMSWYNGYKYNYRSHRCSISYWLTFDRCAWGVRKILDGVQLYHLVSDRASHLPKDSTAREQRLFEKMLSLEAVQRLHFFCGRCQTYPRLHVYVYIGRWNFGRPRTKLQSTSLKS